MSEFGKDFIPSNIEKSRKAKGNTYGTILPIIAKFSN